MRQLASPFNWIETKAPPGSVPSSILAMVMIAIGQGLTIYPYLFYQNGPVIATSLLVLAGSMTIATSLQLTTVSQATGARRFEDMALQTYGRKCATFTSVALLTCMMGFIAAMIVLVSVES